MKEYEVFYHIGNEICKNRDFLKGKIYMYSDCFIIRSEYDKIRVPGICDIEIERAPHIYPVIAITYETRKLFLLGVHYFFNIRVGRGDTCYDSTKQLYTELLRFYRHPRWGILEKAPD